MEGTDVHFFNESLILHHSPSDAVSETIDLGAALPSSFHTCSNKDLGITAHASHGSFIFDIRYDDGEGDLRKVGRGRQGRHQLLQTLGRPASDTNAELLAREGALGRLEHLQQDELSGESSCTKDCDVE